MIYDNMLLSQCISGKPYVIAGFSTRLAGDMKKKSVRQNFFYSMGLKPHHLILPAQNHGNSVSLIKSLPSDSGRNIEADALLMETKMVSNIPTIIGVLTADCTPILINEPIIGIVGVVHAGWKGIMNGIITNTIQTIISLGGNTDTLRVSIGPTIGSCCYDVDSERYEIFRQMFGETNNIVRKTDEGKMYVNLPGASQSTLMRSGVKRGNIELLSYCTKCNTSFWWSYRADGKIKGEQMAFVAIGSESLLI